MLVEENAIKEELKEESSGAGVNANVVVSSITSASATPGNGGDAQAREDSGQGWKKPRV